MARRAAKVATWVCEECGLTRAATAHAVRNRYCSRSCANKNRSPSKAEESAYKRRRAIAYRAQLDISDGKTFAFAADREGICRSTMSHICKEFGVIRPKRPMLACAQCRKRFHAAPSSNRKYCSYECHIQSGGPKRAGEAAVVSMKKYGAKKDANHKEIFAEIAAICPVKDLSNAGFGVPDGLAWVANSWQLFDVKNPKTGYGKRGLNPVQKKWADDWRGGPVYLIYTAEEARKFALGEFCGIKRFPTEGSVVWGGKEIPIIGTIND